MNKKLIIISSLLIVLGLLISICTLLFKQIDFDEGLGNESKTYDIVGYFENIELTLEVADVNFYLSNDDTNKAICIENDRSTFTVEVVENTLKIKENYEYKVLNLRQYSEVSLFLNESTYNSLKLDGSTGNIDVSDHFKFKNVMLNATTGKVSFMAQVEENLSIDLTTGNVSIYKVLTKDLNISVTTGMIELIESEIINNCSLSFKTGDAEIRDTIISSNLTMNGSTGDIIITNVTINNNAVMELSTGDCQLSDFIVSNDMTIKTTTGDVKLDLCDAKNININTTTGRVKGTILSEKIFTTKTETGKVNVPDSNTGGICKIETETGNIDISFN